MIAGRSGPHGAVSADSGSWSPASPARTVPSTRTVRH